MRCFYFIFLFFEFVVWCGFCTRGRCGGGEKITSEIYISVEINPRAKIRPGVAWARDPLRGNSLEYTTILYTAMEYFYYTLVYRYSRHFQRATHRLWRYLLVIWPRYIYRLKYSEVSRNSFKFYLWFGSNEIPISFLTFSYRPIRGQERTLQARFVDISVGHGCHKANAVENRRSVKNNITKTLTWI